MTDRALVDGPTRPQLAPGHHLYRAGDGWRLSAPGDRFERVTGPDDVLAAFQAVVTGAPAPAVTELDVLVEAFTARGLLAEDGAAPPRTRARVLLLGDTPVARAVRPLLVPWAEPAAATDPVDEGAIAGADVVISCAGWLPDAAWRRLDDACGAAGVACHRCHVEGLHLFTGPFTVPGGTAGYRDLRARRLAASGVPDELLAHWRHLDDPGSPCPPVTWPGPGAVAVAAGLIAEEVHRWWRTGEVEPVAHEHEVGGEPLIVRRHPVLPIPRTAEP